MIYLIVGASAGLGRSLSEKLASVGHDLILVSSDHRDLEAIASSLMIKYKVRVEIISAEISSRSDYLDDIQKIIKSMGGLDGIFCPVGAVSPVDNVCYNPNEMQYLTHVNYISVVSVITRFWTLLTERPHHTIVIGFGSVAAIRGRNSNVVYSAAKRALMSFFESLRHTAANSNVLVQFYILGYLDTTLAFGRRTILPRANLEILSQRIFDNLQKDFGVAFYPRYWYFITCILEIIPWFLFKRLKF